MITFSEPLAEIYRPEPTIDLGRTTCVSIGAHVDDPEIQSPEEINACFDDPDRWFTSVVVCDGAGPPRAPAYVNHDRPAIIGVRHGEQRNAADIANYAAAFMLDHPSCTVTRGLNPTVVDELVRILRLTRPEVVYTHNPLDLHPTHIAVLHHVARAIALLAPFERPKRFLGGEVWGEITRAPKRFLVYQDCSANQELQYRLLKCFTSQNDIKHYDEVVLARRRSLAGLLDPHDVVEMTSIHLAIDMQIILSGEMSCEEFASTLWQEMSADQQKLHQKYDSVHR